MKGNKMSIKSVVDKCLKEKYSFPKGWETKEQVAADLECSIDRVNELLKPALECGLIEMKKHRVWVNGTVTTMCGYREAQKK
jgi:hypothetical protein